MQQIENHHDSYQRVGPRWGITHDKLTDKKPEEYSTLRWKHSNLTRRPTYAKKKNMTKKLKKKN